MKLIIISIITGLSLLFFSCGENHEPTDQYIKQVKQYRQEKNDYMKDNPASPFNQDSLAQFKPLNYYPVDPGFVFIHRL